MRDTRGEAEIRVVINLRPAGERAGVQRGVYFYFNPSLCVSAAACLCAVAQQHPPVFVLVRIAVNPEPAFQERWDYLFILW